MTSDTFESLREENLKLREALRKAIANLSYVSVYDDADEDDPEAIESRAAWNKDIESIRAALGEEQT